jgi:hypothetical protein
MEKRDVRPTLNSSSGMASAKRVASSDNSASSNNGAACVKAAFRLGRGMFFCELSFSSDGELEAAEEEEEEEEEEDDDGLEGKKHLKRPSACHLVACVKLIHTSIRPGRLSAGSSRSM